MQVDFLIIGQGICGTFLSWYLQKANQRVIVIDGHDANAPSRVAAGIINPVTGRRMVTVWMAETVLPFAWQAYKELGEELGIAAIAQRNLIDFFPNPFMRENFLKRLHEGNTYAHPASDENAFNSFFNYEFGCGEIRPAYTAHLEVLLPAWRNKLVSSASIVEEHFDTEALELIPGGARYRDIEARKVIFCDGAGGAANPFFQQLPFALNKGEALVVHIPGLPGNFLFKKSMLLAPLPGAGKDMFWLGSNYIWDFADEKPTTEFREAAEATLREWLKLPFSVVAHRSAVRPATVERRPFVGLHPVHTTVGILNGMGTKGSSLAPFFAHQLAGHLLHGQSILPEADVRRYNRVLSR